MLGRCRLRRGVSLEVIVEEDDNAEVVFDPLMEEDDDEDDDDDSENGTSGSTPSSPRDYGDRRGGRGSGREGEGRGDDGEGSSIEERRRKRERRRTIGGLSRFRSVSCEALTLLDTSDMESCCSEWDDEDELATSNSSNYVTLNRPISRRRIIESSQSQCDSEDSGIEYHSNEDDHVLEDHSSNDAHVQEEEGEEEEEEVADREVDHEDEMEEVTSSIEEPTEEDEDEDRLEDHDDDEAETATIIMESDNEAEDSESGVPQDVGDTLLTARTGKKLFEERTKKSSVQEEAQQTGKFNYSPNEALENDKIIIVETTPSVKKPSQMFKNGLEAAEEEMRLKREAYTIRNKEVRLAELPKPDTVKSVKQLFENLKTPVQHFHAWRDLGRFREIKSNPSSKILRFDRSDGNDSSPHSLPSFLSSSSTLPRLPSQGGFHFTPIKTTAQKVTKTTKSNITDTHKKTTINSHSSFIGTPLSKILTQSQSVALKRAQGESINGRSEEESQQPIQLVKTQSGQKVALRKPIVKGFNVKKALMDNPRNFLPHNHPNNQTNTHQQMQQMNTHHNNRLRQQSHISKSHHHHSEITDRSDTESLASDISDDSGVSNDSMLSSSSSSTPSTYRAFDAYASDPSFKWIDPEVMAKIRSVGTTVIFFGPRARPTNQGGGTLPRGNKSISSGLQATPAARIAQRVSWACQQMNESSSSKTKNRMQDQKVPGPRIVGVVRKQSPNPNPISSQNTHIHTDTHSDDSRSSSPGSRLEDESGHIKGHSKTGRWRNEGDTVVYNFTRPQPPAVYF